MRFLTLLITFSILIYPLQVTQAQLADDSKRPPGTNDDDNRHRDRNDDRDDNRDHDIGIDTRTETYRDVRGLGIDAFSIEVPEDWEFEAEIEWYYGTLPVYTTFICMNSPDETCLLAMLPMQSYIWYTDPGVRQYLPEGSEASEGTYVMRDMAPDEYLEDKLIPYLRDLYDEKYTIRNFDIVEIEDRPDFVEQFEGFMDNLGASGFYDYHAAEALVEYTQDGVDVEEKVGVVIGYREDEMPSITEWRIESSISWIVMVSVVQKAPVGELDDWEGIYENILGTLRYDDEFLEKYWELHDEAWERREGWMD